MQRDHYLPLKIIKEHIEAMDRGLTPQIEQEIKPKIPSRVVDFNQGSLVKRNIRVTKEELIKDTGISDKDLNDSLDFGLISVLADNRHFDENAIKTSRVIAALSEYGIEPRHLKVMKSGSEREVSLIKQNNSRALLDDFYDGYYSVNRLVQMASGNEINNYIFNATYICKYIASDSSV